MGRAAPLAWRGGTVSSGIVKHAVDGAWELGLEGFPGDEQADLTVHGGPDKAVCAYAVEHRAGWEELLGVTLPSGAFGENLTLAGLGEDAVHIGDVLTVGGARVQVSQPRGPCYKLAARWGRKDLPALMARGGRSGYYFRVLEPGAVRAGDELVLRERSSDVSVADVMRVTYRDRRDSSGLEAVLAVPELAQQWRDPLLVLARRALLPLRDFGTEDS